MADMAALYLKEQFEVLLRPKPQQRGHNLLRNHILPGFISFRCSPMILAPIKKLLGHRDLETTALVDWQPARSLP